MKQKLEELLHQAEAAGERKKAEVLAEGLSSVVKDITLEFSEIIDMVLKTQDPKTIQTFIDDTKQLLDNYKKLKKSDKPEEINKYSRTESKKVLDYVKANYSYDDPISIEKISNSVGLPKSVVSDCIINSLNYNFKKVGDRLYLKFSASSEDIKPLVKKAWEEVGYVSAPVIVHLGYGSRKHLQNIGKALRCVMQEMFPNNGVEKTIQQSRYGSSYTLYHPQGKKPENIIEC